MGATETVDLFIELINDDRREDAVALFAENAVLGVSVPGSDERTNLRGRDKVGGWFIRAGDGFRMYSNDSRSPRSRAWTPALRRLSMIMPTNRPDSSMGTSARGSARAA